MALFVNSNLHALNTIDQNRQISNQIAVQFQRLSSGSRINSAKDDAAGLSIQTRMTASIRGNQTAQRNANDFVSLFQTAEGGLQEVGNILQRIRELAVQSANATNNNQDRNALNKEVVQLQDEIQKIATQTNFNQINVLDGSLLNQFAQIGSSNETLSSTRITIDDARVTSLGTHARLDSLTGVVVGAIEDTRIFDDAGRSTVTFVREHRVGSQIEVEEYGIRETTAADDQISSNILEFDTLVVDDVVSEQLRASSAIAKAKAINDSSGFTGVTALVGPTRTDDDYTLLNMDDFDTNILDDGGDLLLGNSGAVQAVELGRDNIMYINGVAITDVIVEEQDASGTLVDAINAQQSKTGVIASINGDGELVLEAKDGRNIAVQYRDGLGLNNDVLEGLIGLRSGDDATFVYGGKLTLISEEGINISNYYDGGNVSTNEILGGLSTQRDSFGDSIFLQDQPDAADYFLFHERTTLSGLSIDTVENANKALTTLDFAIDQVSSMRSEIGAQINRFESAMSALRIENEELSDAVSQIRDTDFASTTALLARQQIVQQSSISILAQSNFESSLALSLVSSL